MVLSPEGLQGKESGRANSTSWKGLDHRVFGDPKKGGGQFGPPMVPIEVDVSREGDSFIYKQPGNRRGRVLGFTPAHSGYQRHHFKFIEVLSMGRRK